LGQEQTSAYVSSLYTEWLDDQRSQAVINDKFDDASRTEALLYVLDNPLSAAPPSVPQIPQVPAVPPVEVPPAEIPPADPGAGSDAPAVPEAPVVPAPGDGQ